MSKTSKRPAGDIEHAEAEIESSDIESPVRAPASAPVSDTVTCPVCYASQGGTGLEIMPQRRTFGDLQKRYYRCDKCGHKFGAEFRRLTIDGAEAWHFSRPM